MDVSPETIRAVEFRERLRGYNQDDVDQFLERMAAGIEILQQRLRDADERAARAEQQAQRSDGDESLRRTLALAQRTADLAVQEAREQAARVIEAAQGQGHTIVAEAEEQARRLAEEAQAQVKVDVARLEAVRNQLRQDVGALERFLEDEREKAHLALAQAARGLAEAMASLSSPAPMHEAAPAPDDDAAPSAEAPSTSSAPEEVAVPSEVAAPGEVPASVQS